jgi:MAF protein
MPRPIPPLILASSSVYRQRQLAALGIDVIAEAANIDEQPLRAEAAYDVATRLAAQKARTVAQRHPDALVIGSDQVACFTDTNGQPHLLGKPGNRHNAVTQLLLCAGQVIEFHTALSISQLATNTQKTQCETVKVHFKPLSQQQIEAYVDKEHPFDCAGSFKSEGLGVLLFDKIESRDPNTLIGLPVMLLRDLLQEFNIDLLQLATA